MLSGRTLVATCKGIDVETGEGPGEIIRRLCPNATPALLSGPSFAVDVAAGLPTALTLAASEPERLQHALTGGNLRLYRSTDMIGVETGGAMKNVIAIACGLAIGAGLEQIRPRRPDDARVRRDEPLRRRAGPKPTRFRACPVSVI